MDAKIQPNAKRYARYKIYTRVEAKCSDCGIRPATEKGAQDVAGLGSRTPTAWQRRQSVILQGVRVKIHVFLSSGTELPDFSCFPAHLVAEAKIRCWKGSLVVLRCWEELVGFVRRPALCAKHNK